MQIKINPRVKVPIYVQVMDEIKHMIVTGALKSDDQLPTVRQLATELRVNFNTIARAYRQLDEEGWISTQHGRGTFILPQPSGEKRELLHRQGIEWLTRRFLSDAASLGYTPEAVRKVFEQHIQSWDVTGLPPAHKE